MTDDDGNRMAITDFTKKATEAAGFTHIEFKEKEETDRKEKEAMQHPVINRHIETYYAGTNPGD